MSSWSFRCCPATLEAPEYFAEGAVELLDASGVVDALCFGSELGNLLPLKKRRLSFLRSRKNTGSFSGKN